MRVGAGERTRGGGWVEHMRPDAWDAFALAARQRPRGAEGRRSRWRWEGDKRPCRPADQNEWRERTKNGDKGGEAHGWTSRTAAARADAGGTKTAEMGSQAAGDHRCAAPSALHSTAGRRSPRLLSPGSNKQLRPACARRLSLCPAINDPPSSGACHDSKRVSWQTGEKRRAAPGSGPVGPSPAIRRRACAPWHFGIPARWGCAALPERALWAAARVSMPVV